MPRKLQRRMTNLMRKKEIPIEPKQNREPFRYSQKRGLVQFPVLRFLVSYGKTFSLISAFLALYCNLASEPPLGLKAPPYFFILRSRCY